MIFIEYVCVSLTTVRVIQDGVLSEMVRPRHTFKSVMYYLFS